MFELQEKYPMSRHAISAPSWELVTSGTRDYCQGYLAGLKQGEGYNPDVERRIVAKEEAEGR